MSFDVSINEYDFNYTYNMGKFFRVFSVHPLDDLDGMLGVDAACQISEALSEISFCSMENLKEAYDSPNGWGTVETAMDFLFEIMKACMNSPDEVIEVS